MTNSKGFVAFSTAWTLAAVTIIARSSGVFGSAVSSKRNYGRFSELPRTSEVIHATPLVVCKAALESRARAWHLQST